MHQKSVPKYMKQTLTRIERRNKQQHNTAGDFNTWFSLTVRTRRQKINKETKKLNNTMDQLDLTDIYRTLTVECTFFSHAHGTFAWNMLGHKTSINKF